MEPEGIFTDLGSKRNDHGPGNEDESLTSGWDDLSESSSIVTTEDDEVVGWEESSNGGEYAAYAPL
jgi:hypothetical protein